MTVLGSVCIREWWSYWHGKWDAEGQGGYDKERQFWKQFKLKGIYTVSGVDIFAICFNND